MNLYYGPYYRTQSCVTNFNANSSVRWRILLIQICSIGQWGKILVIVMGFVDTFEPDCHAFKVLTSLTVQAVLKWDSPKYWCGNRKWQQILFFVQFLFSSISILKKNFFFFFPNSPDLFLTSYHTSMKTESSSKYTLHNGHQNIYEVAFKFL